MGINYFGSLAHDPEKWAPAFRKDYAKKIS